MREVFVPTLTQEKVKMAKAKNKNEIEKSNMENELEVWGYSSQFDLAEQLLREKHAKISSEPTHPAFVEKRPDGFDYVTEGYMRAKLGEHYPIWSWKPGGDNAVQFLGGE